MKASRGTQIDEQLTFALSPEVPAGNYLVAGATGLMGTTALLRMRNKSGIKIRATIHERKPVIAGSNIEYIKVDFTDREDCRRAVQDIDYVLMFAGVLSTAPVLAKNPLSHITGNMIMNSQILEAAYTAGTKRFLWLSSTTGYPLSSYYLKEDDMFEGDPPDNYFYTGWMSRYTEKLCSMYSSKLSRQMTTVILRPTNIYGEYEGFDLERCHFLPALVKRVVDRQNPLEIWGDGGTRRDLVYCDDVFDACLLALNKVTAFDCFNIGSGTMLSIREILEMLISIDEFQGARIVFNKSKPTSITERHIDTGKAVSVLGFHAKTNLTTGITKLIDWYRRCSIDEKAAVS